jgi:uncharacterized protein
MWPEREQGNTGGNTLLLMALLTILAFGGGGVALLELVQHRDAWSVMLGSATLGEQLLLGLAAGAFIGGTAWAMVRSSWMTPVRERYALLIGPLLARRSHRWLISLCAGMGEELFFRGAVQWWLGIPFTAVIFVAIHGYLDPRDRRIMAYGALMTLGMMLLGWMADRYGLVGPMLAHTLIDVILLERLHATWVSLQGRVPTSAGQSLA